MLDTPVRVSITKQVLTALRDATLVTLFPTACRVCGEIIESWRDGIACATCWEKIVQTRDLESACAKCGAPLKSLPFDGQINERRCGRCDHFAFNYARAVGPYEGALRESVLWLKTNPHLSPRVSQLLISSFAASPELRDSESIVPVPLHPRRLSERTFNQAEIIAAALSSATGLRVETAGVVRVKQTAHHRAGMGARERARSLAQSFQVRAPRLIENRALLVVDDVMTTASTAHEIAQTLIEGGARSVKILTLARAVSELG